MNNCYVKQESLAMSHKGQSSRPLGSDNRSKIVTRIAKSPQGERERSIVEGNRELIRIYEEKVKKVIGRVWEG